MRRSFVLRMIGGYPDDQGWVGAVRAQIFHTMEERGLLRDMGSLAAATRRMLYALPTAVSGACAYVAAWSCGGPCPLSWTVLMSLLGAALSALNDGCLDSGSCQQPWQLDSSGKTLNPRRSSVFAGPLMTSGHLAVDSGRAARRWIDTATLLQR